MPVNRLKLIAFAFGAAIAALTGTLFAALNASVFPQTFEFPLLITVYTMVILGGAGQPGGRRRSARSSSTCCSSCCAIPATLARSSTRSSLLALIGTLRPLAEARVRPRRDARLRLRRARDRGARSTSAWTAAAANGGGRSRDCDRHWVVVPGDLAAWVDAGHLHRPGRGRPGADAGARLACGSRCSCRRSTSAAFVWENVLLAQARADALHRARRDADRADDRPARTACSASAAWRSSDGGAAARAARRLASPSAA